MDDEDSVMYYVRAKGKLTCPPGYDKPLSSTYSAKLSCDDDMTYKVKRDRDIHGYIIISSLKSLCLHFVAQHIHLVESLVDFPAVVGKELFNSTVLEGKYNDLVSESSSKILRCFVEAYKDEVISALSIKGSPRAGMILCESFLKDWHFLTCLDLCGCELYNHSLLHEIGCLESLKKLGLESTGISNNCVRQLTSPLRILQRGPSKLSVLQLSMNRGITNKALVFLLCFENILHIDLSGTSVLEDGLRILERAGLCLQEQSVDVFTGTSLCHTVGWASEAVSKWLVSHEDVLPDRNLHNPQAAHNIPLLNFYKRKHDPQTCSSEKKLHHSSVHCPRIYLTKCKEITNKKENQGENESKKRKRPLLSKEDCLTTGSLGGDTSLVVELISESHTKYSFQHSKRKKLNLEELNLDEKNMILSYL